MRDEDTTEREARQVGRAIAQNLVAAHAVTVGAIEDAIAAGYLVGHEAGRASVLGDLSEPVVEHPFDGQRYDSAGGYEVPVAQLPPSGLVVHDLCCSCGATLIGPWDKRAETLALGKTDGWVGDRCADCSGNRVDNYLDARGG